MLLTIASLASSFQVDRPAVRHSSRPRSRHVVVAATENNGSNSNRDDTKMGSSVDEYRNAPTAFLSNFMKSDNNDDEGTKVDPLADIDFDAPKVSKLSLEDLAAVLDAELYEKEWFVTGKVNPIYFDDEFQFQDPDVKLTGIEDYSRGVLKLFDQSTSRAQIISTVVNSTVPNTITVTWRLSGGVNIGPGLPIKPYICYTDFTVDEDSGLVTFQEDRFDIPGWDILLSALFPFLIGKVTSDPAPEVEPRVVPMPVLSGGKKGGIFDGLFQQMGL